jgi:hypothetical protein
MATIRWEKYKEMFESGVGLYLGTWRVGSVSWVSGSSKDTHPKNYGAFTTLPGLKTELGKYANEPEAKARVERAVEYWMRGAGIKEVTIVQT